MLSSQRMHTNLKYSNMVFIAEGGNIQAFYKVLKDLEKEKLENVVLIYIAESPDELAFISEVEYWMKSTKWTIEVTIAGEAPKDWQYQISDLNCALPYRKMPKANSSTIVFAAVNNVTRPDLSDRLVSKGYKPEMIRWFN